MYHQNDKDDDSDDDKNTDNNSNRDTDRLSQTWYRQFQYICSVNFNNVLLITYPPNGPALCFMLRI